MGKNVFINFDCEFLDFGGIIIEDGVLIAPKVGLLTQGHPRTLNALRVHITVMLRNRELDKIPTGFTLRP